MKVRCTRCDICDQEFTNRKFMSLKVIMFDNPFGEQIPPTDRRKLDICPECARDMKHWILTNWRERKKEIE